MNELPEDLAQWPANPHELLGITGSAERKEIKRAYAALIRRFKPDHHPEHFRRIREAYEAVMAQVDFWANLAAQQEGLGRVAKDGQSSGTTAEAIGEDASATNLTSGATDAAQQAQADGDAADPIDLTAPDRRAGAVDRIAKAWELAVNGDEAAAYAELKSLMSTTVLQLSDPEFSKRPRSQRAAVEQTLSRLSSRLYWMLDLNPALDSKRTACDWLYAGLIGCGLDGPLLGLLHGALTTRPTESLREAYETMLKADGLASSKAVLLHWRWADAAREGRWSLILDELPRYHAVIVRDSEESWARAVFCTYDHAIWDGLETVEKETLAGEHKPRVNRTRDEAPTFYGSAGVYQALVSELGQLEHLSNRMQEWFDKSDYLRTLVVAWNECRRRQIPADLLELVRESWNEPYPRYRPRLLKLLRSIAERPQFWLEQFDEVVNAGFPVLVRFHWLLDQYERELPQSIRPSQGKLQDWMARLVAESTDPDLLAFRRWFVDRCIREFLGPDWLCEAVLADPPKDKALCQIAEAFRGDAAATALCRAVRIFWT